MIDIWVRLLGKMAEIEKEPVDIDEEEEDDENEQEEEEEHAEPSKLVDVSSRN